jgi:DNA repair exonuclease SbcCD ATPase subunit
MNTAPPRLVVHALPGGHALDLAQALVGAETGKEALPVSLDEAAEHLARNPEHRLCILYLDPVRMICTAMTQGGDLAEALGAWTTKAHAALTLHRRNRRRSIIFEAGHLQRYAAAGLDRLGIKTDSRTLGTIADTTPPPAPLHYLLAQSLLNETPAAKAAAAELDASAQILSNEEGMNAKARALEAYEDLQGKMKDAARLPVLLDEVSQLQTQVAAETGRAGEAGKEVQTLRKTLAEEAARNDRLSAEHTSLTSENEALKGSLDQERQAKEARIKELERSTSAERASLAAEHDRLMASLRQQIDTKAAQIATLEAQVSARGADMAMLETKISVLTEQTTRDRKAQEQMLQEMTSQQDAHRVILNSISKRLEGTTQELSARRAALTEVQAYIDHLMKSRSMRLTRPLRAVGRFLRGSR